MMREKEIKKKLMAYEVVAADLEKMNAGKKEIEKMYGTRKKSISYGAFLIEQVRFIQLSSWLLEGMVLLFLFVSACMLVDSMDYLEAVGLSSALTPLIIVMQAEAFGKSFSFKMNELEAATKFSLKHLVTARLCIFGVVNLVSLSAWIVFLSHLLKMHILYMIAYTCVPFNIATIGMFLILLYGSEQDFIYKAGALTLMVVVVFFGFSIRPQIYYAKNMISVWIVLLGLTAFVQGVSAFKLIKKAATFHNVYAKS